MGFGQHWTFPCCAGSSAPSQPYMWFLSVGPRVCPAADLSTSAIRLPSDSISRWTPLPSANGSCYRVRSGLSPPSCRPCRAHKNPGGETHVSPPGFCFSFRSKVSEVFRHMLRRRISSGQGRAAGIYSIVRPQAVLFNSISGSNLSK